MQRFKYIIVSSAVALALTAANLSAQQGPAVPGTGGGGGGAGDASAANQSAQIALEAKIATGTAGTATGSSTTPSVNVSSAADEIVVDTLNIIHTGTLTVDGSQTQRWQGIGGFGAIKYAGSTETGAGTTTMSWSNSTSQDWALSAVSVKPSGSDAGASGDALFFGIGL